MFVPSLKTSLKLKNQVLVSSRNMEASLALADATLRSSFHLHIVRVAFWHQVEYLGEGERVLRVVDKECTCNQDDDGGLRCRCRLSVNGVGLVDDLLER